MADIEEVAKIHIRELPGFQSILGLPFLRWYYQASRKLPHIFTFVAKENKEVVGLVSCSDNPKSLWLKMFILDPFGCMRIVIPSVALHPQRIRRLLSMLSYPGFSDGRPELLTLAVTKSHQRRGIGRKLVKEATNEFKRRGINTYVISTYDRLAANGFYKKIGCQLIETFNFLGEKMNYYTYGTKN